MSLAICFTVAKVSRSAIRSRSSLIVSSLKECLNPRTCHYAWAMKSNSYSNDNDLSDITGEKSEPNPKKKKPFIPKVTLISEKSEMAIVTLEMAEKLAARRNLKLIKVLDPETKTERAVYKLMTSKDYIQQGLESKKQKKRDRASTFKEEKLFSISTKISDHDLQVKCKSITKLLKKRHEIRILLSLEDNKERAEEIYNHIKETMKDVTSRISRTTSSHHKIYLRPVIEVSTSEASQPAAA